MNASSVLGLALLFLLPAQNAPKGRAAGIQWSESYEKAFADANDRGVPVLIAVIEDGEEANDDVYANTMLNSAFVAATERTVNLIANRGSREQHGTVSLKRDGQSVEACARFGTITCAEHKKTEIGVFRDFASNGELKTPMVILALPDTTIVAALHDRHPLEEFLAVFKAADAKLPNGLSATEANDVRTGLADCPRWFEAGEVAKVIAFAKPFESRKTGSTLVAAALKELEKVVELGKRDLASVEQILETRDYPAAVARLDEIAARFTGSRVETIAKERKANLLTNKDVKAALAKAKREEQAKKLLEQADKFKADGKLDRANKVYDQIRAKFADTLAGSELAARG